LGADNIRERAKERNCNPRNRRSLRFVRLIGIWPEEHKRKAVFLKANDQYLRSVGDMKSHRHIEYASPLHWLVSRLVQPH
jgi:hypothetical protein